MGRLWIGHEEDRPRALAEKATHMNWTTHATTSWTSCAALLGASTLLGVTTWNAEASGAAPSKSPVDTWSLHRRAQQCEVAGDYACAEQNYRQAIIREKAAGASSRERLVRSLNELADLFQSEGEFVRAERHYNLAIKLAQQLHGPTPTHRLMRSLDGLARIHERRGDFARAAQIYTQMLAIQKKLDGKAMYPSYTRLSYRLAFTYECQGNYQRSIRLCKRALLLTRRAGWGQTPVGGNATLRLADAYFESVNYKQAERLYKQAEPLCRRSGEMMQAVSGDLHPDMAQLLSHLAFVYASRGDYGHAESLHQRALTAWEQMYWADHPEVARSLNNLAAVSWAQGDVDRAIRLKLRAGEIEEANLDVVLAGEAERPVSQLMASLPSSTNLAISLHLQGAPKSREALRLAVTTVLRRKARVLDVQTSPLQLADLNSHANTAKLFKRLFAQRWQLATLGSSRLLWNFDSRRTERVNALLGQLAQLQTDLGWRASPLRAVSRQVTIGAVQAVIADNAKLVELVRYMPYLPHARGTSPRFGSARYAAYVLSRQQVRFSDLGPAAPIDAAVQRLRAEISVAGGAVREVARALDELVMAPVRPLLGSVPHVLLSPDGVLNLVPFEALVGPDGRYLIEHHEVTYLTTGRELLDMDAGVPRRGARVVVANPTSDKAAKLTVQNRGEEAKRAEQRLSRDMPREHLPRQSNVEGDGQQVAKLLGTKTTLLTAQEATEPRLESLAGPEVLHLGARCFFLGDEQRRARAHRWKSVSLTGRIEPVYSENLLLRSGLVLAGGDVRRGGQGTDGVLTALELSSMDLRGTRLVVMPACDTGPANVRNGESVAGLHRALKVAGAETQVMSLWRVDAQATAHLLTGYYERLQRGEGRGEALRQVRLEMLRGDKKWRSPHVWAAFTMTGDWRPTKWLRSAEDRAPEEKLAMTPGPAQEVPKVTPGARGCGCETGAGGGVRWGWLVVLGLVLGGGLRRWRGDRGTY